MYRIILAGLLCLLAGGVLLPGKAAVYAVDYSSGVDGVTIEDVSGGAGGPVTVTNMVNGIQNSSFRRNSSTFAGGAAAVSGTLSGGILNSVFENNSSGNGGALFAGTINGGITGSSFIGNTSLDGGAVNVTDFYGGIASSVFRGNHATGTLVTNGRGGAVMVMTGLTGGISNSEFSGNTSVLRGGAVYAPNFDGNITQSSFISNSSGSGGALYVRTFRGDIVNSRFQGNTAVSNGGALTADALDTGALIADSSFIGNSAGAYGGAVFSSYMDGVTISGGSFLNNTAGTEGGALFLSTVQNRVSALSQVIDVTLTADAGKALVFSGNRDSEGANSIYFGRYNENSSQTGDSLAAASLIVSGAGKIELLDPIRVDMTTAAIVSNPGYTFSFLRDTSLGAGELVWGGNNRISAVDGNAVFTFGSGMTTLLSTYTLTALNGTDLQVAFQEHHTIALDLTDRVGTLAVLDYTGGGGGSTLSWEPGTTFTVARSLVATEGRYLLVDGYLHAGLDPAEINFVNTSETKFELDDSIADQLWLSIKYTPSRGLLGYRPNVRRALSSLDQLLRHTEFGLNLTDEQYQAFLRAIDTMPPEVGVTMGLVSMQTHGSVVDQALRTAFSAPAGRTPSAAAPLTCAPAPAVCGDEIPAPDLFVSGGCSAGQGPSAIGMTIWAGYIGNFTEADTHNGYMGYDTTTNGFLIGFGGGSRTLSFGGYGGYTTTKTEFDELRGSGDSEGIHGGIYTRYTLADAFSLTADGAFSRYDTDAERRTVGYSSHGSFTQFVYSTGLTAAYEFTPWDRGRVTPFMGARGTWARQNGFAETGGPLSARVGRAQTHSFVTSAGMAVTHDFLFGNGTALTPYLEAGWKHEYGDRYVKTRGNTYLEPIVTGEAPIPFATLSLPRDRDIFQASAGMNLLMISRTRFELGVNAAYGLEASNNYIGHSVFAGLDLKF